MKDNKIVNMNQPIGSTCDDTVFVEKNIKEWEKEIDKEMKTGIDIKQFKKWLLKNVGKKCPDYNWDCFVCRSWRLYEDLDAYLDFIKELDKIGIDTKEIRPHSISK